MPTIFSVTSILIITTTTLVDTSTNNHYNDKTKEVYIWIEN